MLCPRSSAPGGSACVQGRGRNLIGRQAGTRPEPDWKVTRDKLGRGAIAHRSPANDIGVCRIAFFRTGGACVGPCQAPVHDSWLFIGLHDTSQRGEIRAPGRIRPWVPRPTRYALVYKRSISQYPVPRLPVDVDPLLRHFSFDRVLDAVF